MDRLLQSLQDRPLLFVGGKGGVGKSIVALTLVQFLIDRYGDAKTVHVIETDESNPDVGRVYRGKVPVTSILLDEKENGWITMATLMEKSADTLFVINSAARSNLGIAKNGANFSAVLESGGIPYDLVSFWPMNRQKDSVLLLEDFLRAMTFGSVFPIRNTYFGSPEQFSLFDRLYEESGLLRSRIARHQILDFPELADVLAMGREAGAARGHKLLDALGGRRRVLVEQPGRQGVGSQVLEHHQPGLAVG